MLSLLLACATPAPESAPTRPLPQAAQPAPEGLGAGELPEHHSDLVRSLYALGEPGARARSLLWMRELELSPTQIASLCSTSAQSRSQWAAHQAQLQALETQREAALAQVLPLLEAQLISGPLDAQGAQAHAQALAALDLPDPLTLRSDAVRATLTLAESFWPELSPQQQEQMGSALFLLRALDPGTRSTPPALPEPWQDEDFSTLRRSTPSKDPSISDLFELEDGDPIASLSTGDRQILLAMVLIHPGTQSACEAMLPADPP